MVQVPPAAGCVLASLAGIASGTAVTAHKQKSAVSHGQKRSYFCAHYPVISQPLHFSLIFWEEYGKSIRGQLLLCSVTQLCLTLATPWTVAHQAPLSMGCSRQEILEWVAISFFRGSARPKDRTTSPALAGGFFTTETPGKPNGSVESTLIYKLMQHRFPHWSVGPGIDSRLFAYHLYKALQIKDQFLLKEQLPLSKTNTKQPCPRRKGSFQTNVWPDCNQYKSKEGRI